MSHHTHKKSLRCGKRYYQLAWIAISAWVQYNPCSTASTIGDAYWNHSKYPWIFRFKSFFFFWRTLFSRKLYLKNFNIKNNYIKISQGRGKYFRCGHVSMNKFQNYVSLSEHLILFSPPLLKNWCSSSNFAWAYWYITITKERSLLLCNSDRNVITNFERDFI